MRSRAWRDMSRFQAPLAPMASVSPKTRRSHRPMEFLPVPVRLDWPEALHSAQILRAVHEASGAKAVPAPIMELRVTSPARSPSLQPSVPAGRIGMTR